MAFWLGYLEKKMMKNSSVVFVATSAFAVGAVLSSLISQQDTPESAPHEGPEFVYRGGKDGGAHFFCVKIGLELKVLCIAKPSGGVDVWVAGFIDHGSVDLDDVALRLLHNDISSFDGYDSFWTVDGGRIVLELID